MTIETNFKEFIKNLLISEKQSFSNYEKLKNDIIDFIRKNKKNNEDINNIVDNIIEEKEEYELFNTVFNTQLYSLYESNIDDIDSILISSDYFKQSPESLNISSLYDYTIRGTIYAIQIMVLEMKNEL